MSDVTKIDKETGVKDEVYTYFYTCPNCRDNEIMSDSKYCHNCGIKIKWVDDNV